MTKSVLASPNVLSYLQNLNTNTSASLFIGLILGQTWEERDYIFHVARTQTLSPSNLKNITDINILLLADHAKQATKMLPGGMHVNGIFLVSENDLITSLPPHLKAVIHQLNKSLSSEYLYGNNGSEEKIILNYCSKSRNIKCKSFNPKTSNLKSVELKFSDISWLKLECKYDIIKNYFWEEREPEMDLKEQMSVVLKDVSKSLKSSVILFDGEYKNEDESLESIVGKIKKILKSGKSKNENDGQKNKPILVQILEDNEDDVATDAFIRDTKNQMKVVGQVSSTIWLNPSVSYRKAINSLLEDIMRSLSTRLEMHCDSLIEEEHKEDSNSIHEPPRRVMVAIPGSDIMVSDYLFPGEGSEEAKNSVEEILDIKLEDSTDVIQEVEGFIDLKEYGGNISGIAEGNISKQDKEHGHKLFLIGLVFALLVLIVSIIVHFVLKNA